MRETIFYEPVSDLDELYALESRWLQGLAVLRRSLWIATALSALLIAINLTVTAFDPELTTSMRVWSLFPVMSFGLLLAPLATRNLWLRRRALGAQRGLLGHRGLLGRESDIRAAEDRIAAELSALAPANPRADAALTAATEQSRRLLDELAMSGLEHRRRQGGAEERALAERQLIARLDAYGQILETTAVNGALDPSLFGSDAAREALERAQQTLAPTEDIAAPAPLAATQTVDYSVAVLPFADLSPEGDQEYFANGLAEELIGALTKIHGLRVIARSSAFSFRGDESVPSEIGRRLRVDALIRGSVRKAGERLRVSVQLVETSEGRLLWSERYDGEMVDIFSIQDQLTASVIDHLEADLHPADDERMTAGRTTDIDAYHFYLRGRHLWNKRTPADLRDSLHYFEEAIERDPEYALAHAGLADSHILLGYYSILAPRETFPKARRSAERALEIDDSLAEAHCSLAFVLLLHDWDWNAAEKEFQRTLELSPGYATAHHWYAEYLTLAGRQSEAVTHAATALKLDPISPIMHVLVGWVYYYGRQYGQATEALEAALLVESDFTPAGFWLGLTYEQMGRHEEARLAFERAVSQSDRSPMLLAALARLHAEHGDLEQADALLEELRTTSQGSYVPAYYLAAVYTGYGDREQALECLEMALADRESWIVFLAVDPIWDPYRQEDRFRELVNAVELP